MVQHAGGYAREREHGGSRDQPAPDPRRAARRLGLFPVVLRLLPVRRLRPAVRRLRAAGLVRLLPVRPAVRVALGRLRLLPLRPVRLVLLPVGCVRHVRWLSGWCCPQGGGVV
ncbi:hypothetical protein WKI68_02935 [Streptomyces sp. MS1.HAVA.3]|uniref:Uncharacterized protein n=1 Tax=Streptomyces caledonius TaxID=3134107 RepID=A0ABU8TYH3_9ACTN